MKILLASKSPRRKELLSKIISEFGILVTDADESVDDSLSPAEKVSEISLKKALAAKKSAGENDLIISADTAVFLNGVQYGKPADRKAAANMLKSFSGKPHSVITGFTVCCGEKTVTKSVETLVYFRNLTDEEIEEYIKTDEPYDKAGGYGIQGYAAKFVEKIEGDYSNVVGLPVCELTLTLRDFGLKV